MAKLLRLQNPSRCTKKMSDKKVKFCGMCDGFKCKLCDDHFDGKKQTTSFHQIKSDLTKYDKDKATMIVDLGCPNSVLGVADVDRFRKSLSHFQQENLEIVDVDENFKFGPSGPYRCSEKIKIPIGRKEKTRWVTVAIVDARIPMLLGNNILKPLEAEIKLFNVGNGGNGILILEDEEIDLKETNAGHYEVKVSDLGKLCRLPARMEKHDTFECKSCDKAFKQSGNVSLHTEKKHEECKQCRLPAEMEKHNTFDCKCCDKVFKQSGNESLHTEKKHEECSSCENMLQTKTNLGTHIERKHGDKDQKSIMKVVKENDAKRTYREVIKDIDGEISIEKIVTDLNTLRNTGSPSSRDKKMIKIMNSIFKLKTECENCEKGSTKENLRSEHILSQHHHEENKTESIFLSHHEEDSDDYELEINPAVWNIFLSEDDSKELTQEEEKEVLKLHKYFAHRNARKLWDNLLQPSGRLKGKKRLVAELLDKCEVCRKYKRTPSRPKVGLPKTKDINEVVSIDLKILKKSGNKEVAILYLHDEFSKMIKGQVVNDKNPDTIITAIENKWIIGGGIGPGHPSRGFFSDNGGEFLNESLVDFAAALNISIRMTAAASPWMNGACERSHATVDRIVEKILEDDPKVGIQKAVDLACFVKNNEITKSGFSPIQLHCGKSPYFPGYSDATPGTIELEGSNEYLRVLKRMDSARVAVSSVSR